MQFYNGQCPANSFEACYGAAHGATAPRLTVLRPARAHQFCALAMASSPRTFGVQGGLPTSSRSFMLRTLLLRALTYREFTRRSFRYADGYSKQGFRLRNYRQRLCHKGIVLVVGSTLADFPVQDGAQLTLVVLALECVLTSSDNSIVKLWSVESGECLQRFAGNRAPVTLLLSLQTIVHF